MNLNYVLFESSGEIEKAILYEWVLDNVRPNFPYASVRLAAILNSPRIDRLDIVEYIKDRWDDPNSFRRMFEISNEAVNDFSRFVSENPDSSYETLEIATALYLTIKDSISVDSFYLPKFQQTIFHQEDLIYDSALDLDILTLDKAYEARNSGAITIARNEESDSWTVFGPSFIETVKVDPKTNEAFIVSGNHSFERLTQKMGEQPSDALERDIRKKYPNVIFESKTITLSKVLFGNQKELPKEFLKIEDKIICGLEKFLTKNNAKDLNKFLPNIKTYIENRFDDIDDGQEVFRGISLSIEDFKKMFKNHLNDKNKNFLYKIEDGLVTPDDFGKILNYTLKPRKESLIQSWSSKKEIAFEYAGSGEISVICVSKMKKPNLFFGKPGELVKTIQKGFKEEKETISIGPIECSEIYFGASTVNQGIKKKLS